MSDTAQTSANEVIITPSPEGPWTELSRVSVMGRTGASVQTPMLAVTYIGFELDEQAWKYRFKTQLEVFPQVLENEGEPADPNDPATHLALEESKKPVDPNEPATSLSSKYGLPVVLRERVQTGLDPSRSHFPASFQWLNGDDEIADTRATVTKLRDAIDAQLKTHEDAPQPKGTFDAAETRTMYEALKKSLSLGYQRLKTDLDTVNKHDDKTEFDVTCIAPVTQKEGDERNRMNVVTRASLGSDGTFIVETHLEIKGEDAEKHLQSTYNKFGLLTYVNAEAFCPSTSQPSFAEWLNSNVQYEWMIPGLNHARRSLEEQKETHLASSAACEDDTIRSDIHQVYKAAFESLGGLPELIEEDAVGVSQELRELKAWSDAKALTAEGLAAQTQLNTLSDHFLRACTRLLTPDEAEEADAA